MKLPALFKIALLAFITISLPADEGMWPYNHIPFDLLKKTHSFEPTPALLNQLQKGSVRLNNGGSGSFVSPDGLVMTNHHVASDCIRKLSSKEKDYISDGFYAPTREAELKCPDLELNVLMKIETVTEQVNADVTPEMSDKDILDAQKAAIARISKQCADSTGNRCDVVNLHRGGIFDLYQYKKYTDIRLVFAPEFLTAFFGGDPDNFTFPRYCMDVSFLRIYEGGRPAHPPAVLPLSPKGAKAAELVLVSGHPGSTNRLMTLAQLRYERDHRVPFMLNWLDAMAEGVRAYGETGDEPARLARDELFRYDNSIKAYKGMNGGLQDKALMDEKARREEELRKAIAASPELEKKFGDAWKAISTAQQVKEKIYEEYRLSESLGLFTKYFTFARHLYRLADELQKPNEERLPEYQEAGIDSLYQQIYSPAPIYPELEIVKLTASLRFMVERLGADHAAVKAILQGRSPAAAAKELINGSKLADPDLRKKLGADGAKMAKTSDDPMIAMVRRIDEQARKVRKQYEDEVDAVESAQGARIARARFAQAGSDVYPDATFTLRLATGEVKGYTDNGKQIPPFTQFGGLYDRTTGKDPYILPQRWLDAKSRVKLKTPYNLVSTNDITGGNSGSPLINVKGQVVGLIFDGNIQSLSNDFLYSERQARAVSVDSRGIYEALRAVYGASSLIQELQAAAR